VFVNVTLSLDEKVVRRARQVAASQGKSLNQVIREYLEELAGQSDAERDVAAMRELSAGAAGHSRGWRFNRDEVHERT
jgi:hypothetical protein